MDSFSSKLEKEADEVGLRIAAKSCYDIRQTNQLWNKFSQDIESKKIIKLEEYLKMHRFDKNRSQNLEKIMTKVVKIR